MFRDVLDREGWDGVSRGTRRPDRNPKRSYKVGRDRNPGKEKEGRRNSIRGGVEGQARK